MAYKFNVFTGTLDLVDNDELGPFTPGGVLFGSAASGIGQDSTNFFWDDTNNQFVTQFAKFGNQPIAFDPNFTIRIRHEFTDEAATGGGVLNLYSECLIAPTVEMTGTAYGIQNSTIVDNSTTEDIAEIGAMFFQVIPSGTGTVNSIYGCNGYVVPASPTTVPGALCFSGLVASVLEETNVGAVTAYDGGLVAFTSAMNIGNYTLLGGAMIALFEALTIQNYTGVDVGNGTDAGPGITINGDFYGVRIRDILNVTTPATVYNLFSEGTAAIHYIEGLVGIGTTTPGNPLHLSTGAVVALRIDGAANTAATASAGAATLPANPVGFVNIVVDGVNRKFPYYAN